MYVVLSQQHMGDDDEGDEEAMLKDTKLGNPKAMRLPNRGCG